MATLDLPARSAGPLDDLRLAAAEEGALLGVVGDLGRRTRVARLVGAGPHRRRRGRQLPEGDLAVLTTPGDLPADRAAARRALAAVLRDAPPHGLTVTCLDAPVDEPALRLEVGVAAAIPGVVQLVLHVRRAPIHLPLPESTP